jgi:predicted heme/steroid binding protein
MRYIFLIPVVVFMALAPRFTSASPAHASRTAQACEVCHEGPGGGGLSAVGRAYAASGYAWPPPEGEAPVMGPIKRSVRFVVGYVHVLASFVWFGTILYVHLMLRPAYASKGLPRGEMVLGLASMAAVGISGVLLTVSRIAGLGVLTASAWGVVLLVKVGCYLFMVASAAAMVLVVGPRLKAGHPRGELPPDGRFDPETLAGFDGAEGRPAYIAHGGKVYDVTALKLWRAGLHMKHRAGGDLTEALGRAPHGPEKLAGLTVAGAYDPTRKRPLNIWEKSFYAVAYANLTLVFVVLLVIAYWRWGI